MNKHNHFFRTYRRILLAVLVLLLVPVVIASFYYRPVADDLGQPLPVIAVWRETGSLWEMVKAAFETMAETYMNRSGIFFSMLLSLVPLTFFDIHLGWINILFHVGFLLSALWRAADGMTVFCSGISKEVKHCAALLLCNMVMLFMPSYYEGIFWFSSAVNYTFMISLAIHLFVGVFKCSYAQKAPWWRVGVWCIGFFCLGGANWMTPASAIVTWGALTVWMVWNKKPKRLLLPFAFLLLGFLIAAAAPGNAARDLSMGAQVGLAEAFFTSFKNSVLFIFEDVRYYLFMVLMLPVMYEVRRSMGRIEYRCALWLPMLTVCAVAATMFPVLYKSNYWAERHTVACFIPLCILLPVNLFWIVGWMLDRLGLGKKDEPHFSSRAFGATALAVMICIGVLSVPDMTLVPLKFSCTLQPVKVVSHLLDGQIPRYTQEYDALVENIRNHPGELIIVNKVPTEELLGPHLLTGDPEDWQNIAVSQYYGEGNTIDYVYVKPGSQN